MKPPSDSKKKSSCPSHAISPALHETLSTSESSVQRSLALVASTPMGVSSIAYTSLLDATKQAPDTTVVVWAHLGTGPDDDDLFPVACY